MCVTSCSPCLGIPLDAHLYVCFPWIDLADFHKAFFYHTLSGSPLTNLGLLSQGCGPCCSPTLHHLRAKNSRQQVLWAWLDSFFYPLVVSAGVTGPAPLLPSHFQDLTLDIVHFAFTNTYDFLVPVYRKQSVHCAHFDVGTELPNHRMAQKIY